MKQILTEEQIKSIFNYEEYEPGVALINFYNMLINEIVSINYKEPQIDATKIKISKEFHKEIMETIKEDARKAGYPKTPTKANPISINQGLYQWMNSGPSVDNKLGKYEINILEGGIRPKSETIEQEV